MRICACVCVRVPECAHVHVWVRVPECAYVHVCVRVPECAYVHVWVRALCVTVAYYLLLFMQTGKYIRDFEGIYNCIFLLILIYCLFVFVFFSYFHYNQTST